MPDFEDEDADDTGRDAGALGIAAGFGAVLAAGEPAEPVRPGAGLDRLRAGTGEPEAFALGAPKPPRVMVDERTAAAWVGTRTEVAETPGGGASGKDPR